MGIIYIVKNKINDKVYIGQTTQKLQDRWLKHLFYGNLQMNKNFYIMYNMKEGG